MIIVQELEQDSPLLNKQKIKILLKSGCAKMNKYI